MSESIFWGSVCRSLTRNDLSCALPLPSHRNRRYVPRQRFQQAYARPPSGLRDSATSAYSPFPFPQLLSTGYSSTASRLTGRRRITRRMMSRVSSADTSPTYLCVAQRVRAPYSFSHRHYMANVYVFLTQEPVIPQDLYFPVRIYPIYPSVSLFIQGLFCANSPTVVPRRDRYASYSQLLLSSCLTICDSEIAIRPGHSHHDIQETYPFDATRKSISSSLRPRSTLRLFPQSRQELDDCPKYPSILSLRSSSLFNRWNPLRYRSGGDLPPRVDVTSDT